MRPLREAKLNAEDQRGQGRAEPSGGAGGLCAVGLGPEAWLTSEFLLAAQSLLPEARPQLCPRRPQPWQVGQLSDKRLGEMPPGTRVQ